MTEQPINAYEHVVEEDDFRELERLRLQSLVKRDMRLARQLHAIDFQLITPTGYTYSRTQYLGEIEAGQLTYTTWEPHRIEVRRYQEVVLLRYQATLAVDSGAGGGAAFQCWHTDSYELSAGLWRVVWSQATAIR
jgi:hypothetical protein